VNGVSVLIKTGPREVLPLPHTSMCAISLRTGNIYLKHAWIPVTFQESTALL
jgi:hypothetical protein